MQQKIEDINDYIYFINDLFNSNPNIEKPLTNSLISYTFVPVVWNGILYSKNVS